MRVLKFTTTRTARSIVNIRADNGNDDDGVFLALTIQYFLIDHLFCYRTFSSEKLGNALNRARSTSSHHHVIEFFVRVRCGIEMIE